MELIENIKNKLDMNKDPRIKELIKKTNSTYLAILFAPHIKCEGDFNFRFISQGHSGAGVILVTPDKELPFVIKYDKTDKIIKEKENYQAVKNNLSLDIIAELKDEYGIFSGYSSISYSWAGGRNNAETFRDYYKKQNSFLKLNKQIILLMRTLFEWYKIDKNSFFPFDNWELDSDCIKEKINSWDKDNKSKAKLINAINNQENWRNKLKLKRFSHGKCHGDMNCHNILIVQNEAYECPKLIDFASICEGISPAKDWVKVERDIKFRFLHDEFKSVSISLRNIIERVENACNLHGTTNIEISIEKPCRLISLIRKEYSKRTQNISDAPYLEYLFNLFYITLAYIIHPELDGNIEMQYAVIDSAYRTLEQIEQLIDNNKIDSIYSVPEWDNSSQDVQIDVQNEGFFHDIAEIPEKYKEWVFKRCLEMDISKLLADKDSDVIFKIRMPEIFIPLYTNEPIDEKKKIEREEQKTVDIEELASRCDYLVVRGQAGSGKTTLIKHLTYTILDQKNDYGLNGYLPVLIFLNDLQKVVKKIDDRIIGSPLAEKFLMNYFQETGSGIDFRAIKAFCKRGKVIFLFDGLDEIDTEVRKIIISSLIDFNTHFPCKMLFSGRPGGVDSYVQQELGDKLFDINRLIPSQIELFLGKWFRHDRSLHDKGKTLEMMLGEIKANRHINELMDTPLMMTAICILYHYDCKLPEQRAELYERFINNLIAKRFEKEFDFVITYLRNLAFKIHCQNGKEFDRAFAVKNVLKNIYTLNIQQIDTEGNKLLYNQWLEKKFDEIAQGCGLLKEKDNQYTFWHLTFQEFLTVKYIYATETEYDKRIEKYWNNEWYREVVKLFIGYCIVQKSPAWANKVIKNGLDKNELTPFKRWRLASESFIDIPENNRDPEVKRLTYNRLNEVLKTEETPTVLADAGEILGWLGDQREDLEKFIPIEGGKYALQDFGDVAIEPFEIGKFPVTNQWFEKFIKDNGYKNLDFWSDEGKKWLKYTKTENPRFWHEHKWKCPNSPVVGICWYEADAFCKWLTITRKDGIYRLPGEKEWQAAAAGKSGRDYPWEKKWQDNMCNTSETKIGKTSPVGIFAKGCTPEGVADLSGNVWEWTKSDYQSKKDFEDFLFDSEIQALFDKGDYTMAWSESKRKKRNFTVLRGGSWSYHRYFARCAYRFRSYPEGRSSNIGFRCARTL